MTPRSEQPDALRSLANDFRTFLDWYTAVNTPRLREALEDALDTTARRIAYQLTSPDRPSSEIADATERLGHGVASSTVRLWQQEWVRLGLVRQVSAQKRQRVFDLEELGIDIGANLSEVAPAEE